jgi:heavy metal sensor kinase
VALKIAVFFAAGFAVVSVAAFGFLYAALSSNLQARLDDILTKQASDLEQLYNSGNTPLFIEEINRQAKYEGVDRMFTVIMNHPSGVFIKTDLAPWTDVAGSLLSKRIFTKGTDTFLTLKVPDRRNNVRVIVRVLNDDNLMAIGRTLRDNDKVIEDLKEVFSVAFSIILLMGVLSAWLVAKRAMQGVERVTSTAMSIGNQGLSSRVPVGNEGREIASLATAFNDMLERIEALINDLKSVTDDIAHDLKSPLTRIRGIAETTLTGSQNIADYQDMAGNVIEECDKMVSMINMMLEIARTDAGITSLEESNVDLNAILVDIVDIYAALAQDKGILFKLNTSAAVPQIQADKSKLQRAMANLVDNAVKYTPVGGTVSVSTTTEPDSILISVRDTGTGIPAEDIPHIFERFYRSEKSRSTPGSGLGLSLVMAVAKAHKGEVRVESSEAGSSFYFKLKI